MATYTAYFTDGSEETFTADNDWDAATMAKSFFRDAVDYKGDYTTIQLYPDAVYRIDDEEMTEQQIY